MFPSAWVASTKRCKDAGSVRIRDTDATEDAAARRVLAGQKPGGHRLESHYSARLRLGVSQVSPKSIEAGVSTRVSQYGQICQSASSGCLQFTHACFSFVVQTGQTR